MALLDVLRGLARADGGIPGGRPAGRARRRARRPAVRRVTAAVLGPVLAAGTSLTPVVVTAGAVAGVAAVAVAKAAPAKAASGPSVAVVLVNGESLAPETAVLQAAGYTVTPVTPAALATMSQATFDSYAAVVIGDSSTGTSCSGTAPSTSSLGTNWEPWVTGNVAVLGTAPAMPGTSGANALITGAVGYAASQPSSGSATGLYLSLNCGYSTAASGTAVSLLASVDGIGTAGGVTVNGNLACTDAGTVNTWEEENAGTFGGFTSTSLGTGSNGFPSPSCPVREAFDAWPAMFTPVAYDAASDATSSFTASDGVTGQPYVLLGAPPASAATLALAPSTGGEVPAGTTSGGSANPAAAGVAQATAADPVNTENGDFTQSDSDVSIPAFGPSLAFSRTYDAQVAEQQTQTGTPGPLGYGWTDNWAASLTSASSVPGDIYTIAGLGTDTGIGGPATAATAGETSGVVVKGANTYIADSQGNRVLEVAGANQTQWGITMTAGDLYVIAGSPAGVAGDSANATAGSQSLLNSPSGVAVDNNANLFVADAGNNRVVELVASASTAWGNMSAPVAGDIYTVAGSASGVSGVGGDAKAATSSDLNSPADVFIGGNAGSNLYIADQGNSRIQMASASNQTRWGQSMVPWDVYTIAGSSTGAAGSSGDGGAATSAKLAVPAGMTIDTTGNLEIADTGNCRIQEVAKAAGAQWGNTTSFAANDIYTIAGSSAGTCGRGADGGKATSSDLASPNGVASFGTVGNLYIADTANNRIQELSASTSSQRGQSMTVGDIYTVAGSSAGTAGSSGNGGVATSALLSLPETVVNDNGNNLWIADTSNHDIREASDTSPYDITDVAGNGFNLGTTGNGGPALGGGLQHPMGMTADPHGDLYIADYNNARVQEVAAYNHTQWGIPMTAGDVYTVAGQGNGYSRCEPSGQTITTAQLCNPEAVAVDTSGNLYVADTLNNRVLKVAASNGAASLFAGNSAGTPWASGDADSGVNPTSAYLNGPSAVATDAAGDIFIAGGTTDVVQEIPAASGTHYGVSMTAGDLYVIAGTPGTAGAAGDGGKATSADLYGADGVAVDPVGDLYIADYRNNRIQELPAASGTQQGIVMTVGDIYTIAGDAAGGVGARGDFGDGGPATSAALSGPDQIATDSAGDLYITDSGNNRVREIAAVSGTQWSQQMTADDIYPVAGFHFGYGTPGAPNGIGGPATSAPLNGPGGITVDPAGDLFITNAFLNNLDEVTATSASAFPVYPAAASVTVTQPGGAQVTFYAKISGSCAAPQAAGGYCVLPVNHGATLTSNTSNNTYTFVPSPGSDTYVYSWDGQLISDTDTAGDTLTITNDSPLPGTAVPGDPSEVCPAAATSCQTITSASGRALAIGSNSSGLVTSVTDPMGRQWTYGYTGSDLTSVTDPMTRVTSYTYGQGGNGPLQANDLLTITKPNAQPGGPDAGDATVNVYNNANEVTSQTDPMGFKTTFNYCVNATAGDCMNAATGNGFVTVADPNGNNSVYNYEQGTLAAQATWTGAVGGALASRSARVPDTTITSNPACPGNADGSLAATTTADGDNVVTTWCLSSAGDPISNTSPSGGSTVSGLTTTTASFTTAAQNDLQNCDGTPEAASAATCTQDSGPGAVAPGGVITPPSPPPLGITYTQYDTDGSELYSTNGVYSPSGSYEYSQTTYQLFNGNSVTLPGTSNAISCTYSAPSADLPCADIDADGVVTQYQYDAQGDLTSSSTPDGNGSQAATTTDTYDADGEQITNVSPDGNISGANAGNYSTTSAYNADGEQASTAQGNGTGYTDTPRTTTYGYDGDGNQTTVKDARGYTTTTTFNADDQSTLVTNPLGDATLTCYDSEGNTTEVVPPVGVAANSLTPASCPTSYPADYNPAVKAPLAADATMYAYDADGNQTAMFSPPPAGLSGYQTTAYTYDGDDNLIITTAPPTSNAQGATSQVTIDTYNSAGQLASETTGYGSSAASTVSYCYDPDGDQTSVVYGDGNPSGTSDIYVNGAMAGLAACSQSSPWTISSAPQTNFQTISGYDSTGELVSTTTPATAAEPSGATTTSTYDPAGALLTSTDPDNVMTTHTYFASGQVATLSYSGSSAHAVSYIYDANGKMTAMTDAAGSSSYAYDPFGELTSATSGAGATITYDHDADGNMTSIGYPLPATASWASSKTVSYGFDKAGTLTSMIDFNGHQVSITPDANGGVSSEALGATGDTVSNTFSAAGPLTSSALKSSSATLESFSYSDAPSGNLVTETDTPSSPQTPSAYAYDPAGKVASMVPGGSPALTYSFDASGNLVGLPAGSTGQYDHGGELISSSLGGTTSSYIYNPDGQRLAKTQNGNTLTSGTWNGASELTGFADSAATMTSAVYDGNALRASATSTPAGGSAVSQSFLWNTAPTTSVPQLIMDSQNAYIWGQGLGPAEQVNLSTGAASYLVSDLSGSIRGIISDGGTLAATTAYDAWGNPEIAGGLTSRTPFGFAGAYTDQDGLLYLINRYYDPGTGQFLSVDPDLSETQQPYAYASGNPVTSADPSGLYTYPSNSSYYIPPLPINGTAQNPWLGRFDGVEYAIPMRKGDSTFGWKHFCCGVNPGHGIWNPLIIGMAIAHGKTEKCPSGYDALCRRKEVELYNVHLYADGEGTLWLANLRISVQLGTRKDGLPKGVTTAYCPRQTHVDCSYNGETSWINTNGTVAPYKPGLSEKIGYIGPAENNPKPIRS